MNNVVVGLALIVACSLIEGFTQVTFKLSRTHERQRLVWTVLGTAAYVGVVLLYTLALKQIDVTIAFAMGSLSFVVTATLSRLILKEHISLTKGLGLLLILGGVALMGGQA